MIDNDPLIGKMLGAYLIQSKLGEGGMARVYKAYHARLRRDVAIKIVLPQVADKPGFKERFEREAQVVANLEQRNIVAVYDFGDTGNLTYLVMQYIGGGTLRDQLRGSRPLEPRRAALYALQMARALHHAHQRGIVHRDVKPQNMLVSASDPNELLLSDFGIAKIFDTPDATSPMLDGNAQLNPALTNVDQMVGTAEYMAPEQITRQPVDARTDVYALGVVLFQMLTGQVPFHSTTVLGLLYQHVHTPPPPVREINPQVPELLAQITAKALAKAPTARFQSAEEMAQALETYLTPTTYPLSAPLYDSRTNLRSQTGQTQPSPSHMSAGNTPNSYYGAQTQPPTQQPFAQSMPGRQSITDPTTGAAKLSIPVRSRSSVLRPGTFATSIILAIIVIAAVIWQSHPSWLPGNSGIQPGNVAFAPFTETFQNNDRNWTIGDINGLHASMSNAQYNLSVSDDRTYFPHPNTSALPTNFTYSAQWSQNTGASQVFYGLAYQLKEDASGTTTCYAFIIDSNGDYLVEKYGVANQNQPARLAQGTLPAIHRGLHQSNTLEVVAQGSGFSFTVNGQPIPNPGISDSTYTGGLPALLVAGPNTSFTVTTVKLSSP